MPAHLNITNRLHFRKSSAIGHTSNASLSECILILSLSLLSSLLKFLSRALMHDFLLLVVVPLDALPLDALPAHPNTQFLHKTPYDSAIPPCFLRFLPVASSLLDSVKSSLPFIACLPKSRSSTSTSSSSCQGVDSSRDRILLLRSVGRKRVSVLSGVFCGAVCGIIGD